MLPPEVLFEAIADEDVREIARARSEVLRPLVEQFAYACLERNISYVLVAQAGPDEINEMPMILSINVRESTSPKLRQVATFLCDTEDRFIIVPKELLSEQSREFVYGLLRPRLSFGQKIQRLWRRLF